MKEDTLRTVILRSQTLKEIMERDIQSLINLKPTNLIGEKEMTSLVQMAKDEKAGVEVRTINERWKVWADSYSRVLNKFSMLQEKYGEQEIQELFDEAEENLQKRTDPQRPLRPAGALGRVQIFARSGTAQGGPYIHGRGIQTVSRPRPSTCPPHPGRRRHAFRLLSEAGSRPVRAGIPGGRPAYRV